MNVRILVRDDGDLTAAPIHDAWHDTAIEPRPGYVLEIVDVPGYLPPIVEQCAIVRHGAGVALVVRCRATRKAVAP